MIQATPLRTVNWIVVNDDMILIYIAPPQHISLVYFNNLNRQTLYFSIFLFWISVVNFVEYYMCSEEIVFVNYFYSEM